MKAWRKHNQKHRAGTAYHLTRNQARTHFAAEVATPSQLIYLLFAHIGLPTPPEFKESVMSHVNSQPKSA